MIQMFLFLLMVLAVLEAGHLSLVKHKKDINDRAIIDEHAHIYRRQTEDREALGFLWTFADS